MRFAIVSDIHANLQAWNAVLLDIRCNAVDKIICLGDIVGYGPHPAEVLKSVHANVDYLVLGNHDAVVCGKMDAALFNDHAREIIEWTRERLNGNAVKFLQSFPLSLSSSSFRCTHGEFSQPESFLYVIDPEDAMASWQACDEQLLFVGHTHSPAIFLLGQSGQPHLVPPQDFVMEAGKRYLVNCGSVGQPRDGEPRASYCIFDTASKTLCWRRIPFDIDAYRSALSEAGLPAAPSYFLRHDPRQGTPPIRELLNFSPPTSAAQKVQNTVAVQDMETLQKKITRWKSITATVLLLSLALGFLGGWTWWRQAHRALRIAPLYLSAITAESASSAGMSSSQRTPIPEANNLLQPPMNDSPAGQPVEGWVVELGDRNRQSLHVERMGSGTPEFVMSSGASGADIALTSFPIKARPGHRFRLYAELQKSEDFAGQVAVYVDVTSNGRRIEYEWLRNPADVALNQDWHAARRVFPRKDEDFPADNPQFSISVRGAFSGNVRVRNIGLGRLPQE